MGKLIKGKVKWFNDNKGYGFIAQENGPDIFVHYKAIDCPGFKSLKQDDQVEFELASQTQKGPSASYCKKV